MDNSRTLMDISDCEEDNEKDNENDVHNLQLLDELLERFEAQETINFSDIDRLYLELETILGQRIVHGAQKLLKTEQFYILTDSQGLQELAIIGVKDIDSKRSIQKALKLYPNVNYCSCKDFQVNVLGAKRPLKGHNTNCTCKHVLSLRLAFLFERLSQQYDLLQESGNVLKYKIVEHIEEFTDNYLNEKSINPLNERYIRQNISIMEDNNNNDDDVGGTTTTTTTQQTQSSEFIGQLDNIKIFGNSLNAVNLNNYGFIQIDEMGFRCTVEQNKCIQGNLFIRSIYFTEYHLNKERVKFVINLKTLYECLSIYMATECSLKLSYSEATGSLQLLLVPQNEYDIVTECTIRTISSDDFENNITSTFQLNRSERDGGCMDFVLNEESEENPLNTIQLPGSELASIFNTFDKTTEELEIFLSPKAPHFQVTAHGVQQSKSQVEVSNSSDILSRFDCKKVTRAKYKASFLRLIQKCLLESSRTILRTNSSGLLEVHCIMLEDELDNIEIYIRFYITSLVEDRL